LIWFSMAIPKHVFFLWLAIKDCLSTKDKMLKWGAKGEVKCLFCRSCIECRDHLFFECFRKRLWRVLMQKCSQHIIPTDWDGILRKGMKDWKGKSLITVVCKLAWGSTVNNIWRYMNYLKFGRLGLELWERRDTRVMKIMWPSAIIEASL
jgi:hypothetical protein